MKGNELIEKILNKEIRPGTMIKMKSNYPGLEWEEELSFNGNWFSEGKYEPGCRRYDDIILHLCNEYTTFEILEEHKIPEKLKIEQDTPNSNFYIRNEYGTKCALTKHSKIIADKINEILDYLEVNND